MATTVEVRDVRVVPGALLRIARSEEVRARMARVAEEAAVVMRAGEPVRTGAGRASTRGRVELTATGWVAVASWDNAHYYMSFQDRRYRFVEAALARVRYV